MFRLDLKSLPGCVPLRIINSREIGLTKSLQGVTSDHPQSQDGSKLWLNIRCVYIRRSGRQLVLPQLEWAALFAASLHDRNFDRGRFDRDLWEGTFGA
jgi:hypothetical protein